MTVVDWLLQSDPSIRWQVMRDLTGAPADEVAAERARVVTEGWGARLLGLQAADGRWGGAAWNRGWNSTMHVLWLLRHLGLDPASEEARRAVGLVRDHVTWQGCGPPECDRNLAGGGVSEVTAARLLGQEYLLERRLYRRRSTGEVIERDRKSDAAWTRFAFPTWWHYDVLRGLEYLRSAGVAPDERMAEAIKLVASKRDGDGRWPLETRYPGVMPVETDEGEGRPSRWNTLRALRVLRWYERADS